VETVSVSRIDPRTAAAYLAELAGRDPRGIVTADSIRQSAERGHCFAVNHHSGAQAVYIIAVENGQAWVTACRGEGGAVDFTRTLLPAIEHQAQGLQAVAFQTARPGLVRKARAMGYQVTGWILKKDLHPCGN